MYQKNKGCDIQALRAAKEFGIKVTVKAKGLDYLEVLRKPKHGFGKGVNPCIDCKIYILKKVREFMNEIDTGFVITCGVLGQRPMSQRGGAIEKIEKESDLSGLVVRLLSAKHFPPTEPEKGGILHGEVFLRMRGRSRRKQFELVENFHLAKLWCPAGGAFLPIQFLLGG